MTDSGSEPLLSIVVPVLNEAAALPGFLQQMQSWRPQAELILVDGGSEDETMILASGLCDQLIQAEKGRARQMNVGAQQARGRYILFLHCDTRIESEPRRFAEQLERLDGWGFCTVRLSGLDWRLRLIEWAMNVRSRLTGVATGDQLLVFGREFFVQLGGYQNIPLMEDVEICKRARRQRRPVVLATLVETSSRRWEERGISSTVLTMWRLRLAYWLGVDPAKLARRYYG